MKKFKEGDKVLAVHDDRWLWGNQDKNRVGTIRDVCTISYFDYSVIWEGDTSSYLYHEYNLKSSKSKFFQEELEV